ncbi:hypothetical protein [Fodinicola acaciae]|uniref:hypothetical protein n=1 Tax=Fodinicola acaciae TaxID=2681555 RepID=UPI0013D7DAC6|nr:hypothetical protein [Fodinicola acaciae]
MNRHVIEELGLSFAAEPQWPEDRFVGAEWQAVFRHLPGQAGTFFVRYGAGQRIDAFAATLADALTSVTTTLDEPYVVDGRPARRLVLRTNRRDGEAYDVVAVGLEIHGIPVLIGYRVRESADVQPTLEQTLASVTIAGHGG